MSVFDPLYDLIARVIVSLHELTTFAGGADSGLSWALAIVLLTVTVRLLLFPLFVKQIRSQRQMQALAPKVKELQAKHKGDRATLQVEMSKLYKEHNANPLAGCLPLLLQMPIFFSLYTVLRDFAPKSGITREACEARIPKAIFENDFCFRAMHGIDAETARQAGKAKLFGAPIASAFTSKESLLKALDASAGTVRVVTIAFILFMAATTFITQKQLMAKNGPVEGQAATQQKVLLYVMPVMLGVFGINVALGVLLYWTTTNLWSMAQQHVVIAKMGPPPGSAAAAAAKPLVSPKPQPGAKPRAGAARQSANGEGGAPGELKPTSESPPAAPKARPGPGGPNRNKSKKGQRRGGRR